MRRRSRRNGVGRRGGGREAGEGMNGRVKGAVKTPVEAVTVLSLTGLFVGLGI